MRDAGKQLISSRARVLAVPGAVAAYALSRGFSPALAQDKTTVKLRSSTSSGAETDLYNQILDDARAALPNVDIQNELVTADYLTKLQTDIAAGTGPDIFFLDSLPAPNFIFSEALLAIDDYMAKDGVTAAGSLSRFDRRLSIRRQDIWAAKGLVGTGHGLQHDRADRRRHHCATCQLGRSQSGRAGARRQAGNAADHDSAVFDRYLAFHYAAGATVTKC